MQENSKIIMKWTVFPRDYLQGYEEELFSCLQANVENGEITIAKELTDFIDPKNEQLQTQKRVTNFLIAVSLKYKKKEFSLISSGLEVESGRTRAFYLTADSGSYVLSGMDIDLIHTKNDEQLVSEPVKGRPGELRELHELLNEYDSDKIASKIVDSFRNALDHDEKVLIYIYEIRDTLKKCFGKASNAITELSLDEGQWNCLGIKANDPSIKQGRHYSELSDNSRDITDEERRFALSFGQRMIENYLQYLQQHREK